MSWSSSRPSPMFSSATVRSLLLTPLVVAFVGASRQAHAQEAGIAVGTHAPAAAVALLDGTPADLAHYIGKKPVVLEFWATWCPLCRKLEIPLQAARERYGERVTFVSVGVNSNQTADKQRAYATDRHIGGLFVFDRDGKAVAAYKAPHTSYLVVINGDGTVVYAGVGADQDVEAAVSKAFAMGHASF